MKTEIGKQINRAVTAVFEQFKGQVTEQNLIDMALVELPEDIDVSELLILAVQGEVKQQKRLRRIERQDEGMDELFPDTFNERLMTYRERGKNYLVKVGDAQLRHHIQFRENQINDMRRANRSFDMWEQRRDIFLPILQENPHLTTRQALNMASALA